MKYNFKPLDKKQVAFTHNLSKQTLTAKWKEGFEATLPVPTTLFGVEFYRDGPEWVGIIGNLMSILNSTVYLTFQVIKPLLEVQFFVGDMDNDGKVISSLLMKSDIADAGYDPDDVTDEMLIKFADQMTDEESLWEVEFGILDEQLFNSMVRPQKHADTQWRIGMYVKDTDGRTGTITGVNNANIYGEPCVKVLLYGQSKSAMIKPEDLQIEDAPCRLQAGDIVEALQNIHWAVAGAGLNNITIPLGSKGIVRDCLDEHPVIYFECLDKAINISAELVKVITTATV